MSVSFLLPKKPWPPGILRPALACLRRQFAGDGPFRLYADAVEMHAAELPGEEIRPFGEFAQGASDVVLVPYLERPMTPAEGQRIYHIDVTGRAMRHDLRCD